VSKFVRNTTASPVPISDCGVIIPASATYTVYPNEWPLFAASNVLPALITAGTLVVNDGYDDLDKVFGLRHIQEEGCPRPSAYLATASIQATANSANALTAASRLLWVYTGTIAGQIVRLGDARTYTVGHKYEIWNTSNQSISVQNNASTAIFTLAAYQKTWVVLQDKTTQAGTWLFEANFMSGTGGGSGTIGFGFDGNASTGRWLESLTNVASNYTQPVIAGTKAIRALSFAASASSTMTATILKNGVALDTISLAAQIRTTKLNLNHILVNGDYLSAQITAGSGSRPVVLLWM
jgi:hypothetical protein